MLLQELDGRSNYGYFGHSVSSAGDTDGNGLAEVIIGAPGDDNNGAGAGAAFVYGMDFTGPGVVQPGFADTYGTACAGGNNRLPRIGANGPAAIGETHSITLRGAPLGVASSAFLVIGAPRPPLSLAPIGLNGCSLLVTNLVQVNLLTDTSGMAQVNVPIPDEPLMIGLGFASQWMVLDPGAPYSHPLSFSDGLLTIIGS